jgi:hypothetical protein
MAHRYDSSWEFAANSVEYLNEAYDLFARGVAKGQDVAVLTGGMVAIINELHGRAINEDNDRRREAGVPVVRNGHRRFVVHAVGYHMTKPVIVDGRYTRSEKITLGPGTVHGFESAQAASDYVYTVTRKLGNHDVTITVDGAEVTATKLKGLARKEYAARLVRA